MKKLLLSLACILGIAATSQAQVANISELLQLSSGTETTVTSDAVAVAQQGNNLWIKDATGWILVYGSTGQTYENGDVIPAGYGGKFSPYNNLPELASPANFTKGTKGAAVAPTVVTTANFSAQPLCSYVELRGKVEGSGRNFKVTDAAGTANLYTTSQSVTVNTGDDVTVRGFVSIYKTNYQITPVETIVNGGGSVTPEPGETESVASLKDFITKGDKNNVVKVNCEATVLYQLGYNLWITDGTAYLLVYGSTGQTYKNGDVIPAGFGGKYAPYAGLDEMGSPTDFAASTKSVGKVEPTVVMVGDADGEPINSFIEMRGVTITATSNERNFTCSDGVDVVTLHTASSSFVVPTGDNYTVRGFVAVYNGSYQITPVEIVSASGRETVATPTFSVHEGPVPAGTEVSLACGTEGATIYYTIDGTNPSAASLVYSAPIVVNESLTINAIAVKEGMDDSVVATASYTVADGNSTMFNFADITSLTPAYDPAKAEAEANPAENKSFVVDDVIFTNGVIYVKATNGGGNPDKLYYAANADTWTFRVYKKNTLTIGSNDAANPVVRIDFGFNNGNTSAKQVSTTTGTYTQADYAWEGEASEIEFTINGTVQIKTLTVTAKSNVGGVEDVTISEENAPVEYFNLQGVKVANPENGLYIVRQGCKVSKVIIK